MSASLRDRLVHSTSHRSSARRARIHWERGNGGHCGSGKGEGGDAEGREAATQCTVSAGRRIAVSEIHPWSARQVPVVRPHSLSFTFSSLSSSHDIPQFAPNLPTALLLGSFDLDGEIRYMTNNNHHLAFGIIAMW